MGAVYLAEDQRLGRRVAVKMLPPNSVNDPAAVARFQREAHALAQLSHPGIVQAYDAESDDGKHFLVMEYVEGRSLAALLDEKGKLPPTRAADYVHQAALAMQHAHDKGLIHRDLKPSNLLVTPQGQVKVLDLGLARFLQDQIADPGRTREGVGLGTPDYAAPEQFRDAHKADARSDVYSLGCTLFHLLTGQVVFPGSSLSEKCEAHESKAPPSLEELCPDAPAGLGLVVRRMLAKRPADRYATAQAVADALAPFVAHSSVSFSRLKTTAAWSRGELTTPVFRLRRAVLPWAAAGGLAAALAVVLALFFSGAFRPAPPPGEPVVARDDGGGTSGHDGGEKRDPDPAPAPAAPAAPGDVKPAGAPPKPEEPTADPNVLTVAQDGSAQFRTIGDALDKVQPGQTIRVQDDAVYRESLTLDEPRFAGVALEALGRAVIETSSEEVRVLITVNNVPRVALRGFRLRAKGSKGASLVRVKGRCPGLVLEGLEMESKNGGVYDGVHVLDNPDGDAADEPVVVQSCVMRDAYHGVGLDGNWLDYQTPGPVGRVCIRNNLLLGPTYGILVKGKVRGVQVVGNRIRDASQYALQLEQMLPGAGDVLIANNTVFRGGVALRIWDSTVRGDNIQVRNNLFLGVSALDMYCCDSGGDPIRLRGAGDGKAAAQKWRFDHNWREQGGDPPADKGWIPPGNENETEEHIEGVNRDPEDRADFLRPSADARLAREGAGVTDPSLPSYVGALPPAGVEPWDWDRTWRMPADAKLLTVSKDGKADFGTIGEALAKAEPWTTIRVLDDAHYPEALTITDAERQTGLCLEAVKGAVIEMPTRSYQALAIKSVPHVRVAGFRFTEKGTSDDPFRAFVLVTGKATGVTLTGLHLRAKNPLLGVVVGNAVADEDGPPVVVRRCVIDPEPAVSNDGVRVTGGLTRRVCVRDNRIARCARGVLLQGKLSAVHVTGNQVRDCRDAGLQIENLLPGSERVLLANNTAFDCGSSFRVWEVKPYPEHSEGQVELAGNLFFNARAGDMRYVMDPGAGAAKSPGDFQTLRKLWRWRRNHRDQSSLDPGGSFPMGIFDRGLEWSALESSNPSRPETVRPLKGSSLAVEGAGVDDPSLPVYVGALPPEGVEPWDWGRTWRARASKPAAKPDAPNKDKPAP
jgi:hypothetical protein